MTTSRERSIWEDERDEQLADPDETPIQNRRLVTYPYDLVISALIDQIDEETLHLRPISDRPSFQRKYVWTNKLASRLVESILMNVPIPPCYLSQNDAFELDVIDGQQRIYSIYRFIANQFKLSNLTVFEELKGLFYFELSDKFRRKIMTHTLRCVIIGNESHPEIRFDVFERLNTNTMPLNAQELRNCIYRGPHIDSLERLATYEPWLEILNRRTADKRMRGEELILRFYAFDSLGLKSYRTPQKRWLNDAAEKGQGLSEAQVLRFSKRWKNTIDKCLLIFSANECFRRLPLEKPKMVINRALMDLTLYSLKDISEARVTSRAKEFKKRYIKVIATREFDDLITRAIDHKSRSLRRFTILKDGITDGLF